MKFDVKPGQEKFLKVILSPHVSEKATNLSDKYRQYVFKVAKNSDKESIKKAVELLFSVNVDHVRVVNVRSKTKRFGQIEGRRKAWKKAYITLQEGQDINFASNQ